MAVDIKQAQRRLLEEAFGRGNLDAFDAVCDPAYVSHDPLTGDADLGQAKEVCRSYKQAFPDLAPTILGAWTEGDVVITRWRMTGTHQQLLMGIPPTGRRCTVEGVSIARFGGGRLLESWVQWDALGLLRQLGAQPDLAKAARAATEETETQRPRA